MTEASAAVETATRSGAGGSAPDATTRNVVLDHAETLLAEQRPQDALALATALLTASPRDAGALVLAARARVAQDRPDEAVPLYRQAIAAAPKEMTLKAELGAQLLKEGWIGEGVACFVEALRQSPESSGLYKAFGDGLYANGLVEEAHDAFETALRLDPSSAAAANALGVTHRHLGDREAAHEHYALAARLASDNGFVLANLTFNRPAPGRQVAKALRRVVNDESKDPEMVVPAHFALASISEAKGDFDTAFEHFERGNMLQKRLNAFDVDTFIEETQLRVEGVRRAIGRLRVEGRSSRRPIFIVGMPRSGSTLVERILSQHPDTRACGELPHTQRLFHRIIDACDGDSRKVLSPDALNGFRRAYFGRVDELAAPNMLTIDKALTNIAWLGMIALAIPEALFIHTRRNPIENCWGAYFRYFSQEGPKFCNSLDDVAKTYNFFEHLSCEWSALFPGRIHRIALEDLVERPEATIRGLVDFVGLDWRDAFLHPEKSAHRPRTLSSGQVSAPISRQRSAWRDYRAHLGPLFEAFGDPDDAVERSHGEALQAC